ncbi:TonB-dependent siderophore receptor [Kordiimonas pumila]|uniref:TonB-dependent siderophore receptor n=1 Tax=Kordiimonas pumila TaxID=2161677 RepID=A0ABV7D5C1_9PROT|nr:TonB-dependent siderophore receptor [Kordiimonas pumila]
MMGVAVCGMQSSAWAQDAATEEGSEELSFDEIYVSGYRISNSAAKTDTPLIETPQSISIITAETLALRNVQTIEEALRYTPGVVVSQFGFDPRFDHTSIRGFSSTLLGNFKDGMRQIPGFGIGFRTEAYGLSAIEVFKGPASVLYGQNAPGGMVNYTSKRANVADLREFQLDYGNYDRKIARADFGDVSDDGNFGWRITGLWRDSDTQVPGSPDNRKFIAPTVTFNLGDKATLTLLGQYLHDETTATPDFAVVNGELTDIYLSDYTWDLAEQKQLQAGWQFEYRFTDTFTFRQNFRYNDVDLDQRYMFSLGIDPVNQVAYRGRGQKTQKLKSIVIDNQLLYDVDMGGSKHRFLLGVDYSDSDDDWAVDLSFNGGTYVDNTISLVNPQYGLTYGALDPLAVSNEGQSQTGIYLQDQVEIGDLILTVGGRYDSAETFVNTDYIPFVNPVRATVDSDAFTYRVAATYLFENGLAPYASYSTSFQLVSGADVSGNPFEPSKGRQMEVGLKYQPQDFPGFMTLSLFDLTLTNVLTTDPTNPSFQVQTGEVNAQGLEAEVSVTPTAGLDMTFAYTYLDTDITSNGADNGFDRQLQPGHTITVFGDYTVPDGPLEGFGLGGGIRYQSKSFASIDNTLTNDSTFLADAQVHYTFGSWRLGLNATNIFDKEAFTCNNTVSCYPGYRRTVLASLRYRY